MPPVWTNAKSTRDSAPHVDRSRLMRILVLGGSGQLGTALRRELSAQHELMAPASADVNLRDATSMRNAVERARPDVVVNAAAYTRVDDAEKEPELAYAINATAPGVLAGAAQSSGARFLHVSTDYVFDGGGGAPYLPSSAVAPLNVYGASKLAGEGAVMSACVRATVIRTAWVHSGGGTNFIATAVRVLRSGKSMRVVDDQVGTPTSAAHLATAIAHLIGKPDVTGVLHFTDAGVASWFDVATCVLETLRQRGAAGDAAGVVPVGSAEFPRPARRPGIGLLDKHESWTRIGWTPPHWRVGVVASTHEILDA